MALTTDQKASFLFKQAQGVAETSMTRDFFEEPKKGPTLVLNDQIWAQSGSIPATAPTLADGQTSGVVQRFIDRTMTAISGVSNSFYLEDLIDAIPFNFGDGSYNYTIKDSSGNTISFGQGDWLVENTAGVLTFYGTTPGNMPPKISFYKYVGTKGISGGGSGVTSVNGDSGPAVILTTGNIPEGSNLYFTDGRAQTAVVTSDTSGAQTNLAPSIAALKTYVASQLAASSVTSVNGLTGAVLLTTTDIGEGTNLYFTDARAEAAAVVDSTSGSQTTKAPSVAAMKAYVAAQGAPVTSVNTKTGAVVLTTSDISEGTNLYFTNARAQSAAVVNNTAGSETTQAASVSAMKAYVAAQGAPVTSVNSLTGAVLLNTGNVPEGTQSSATWTSSGLMTVARTGLSSAGTQDAAMAFGGYNGAFVWLSSAERFNGTTWSSAGSMTAARGYLASCGTQTAALIFGGRNSSVLSSAELYNGSTYSSTGSLSGNRMELAAAGIQNAGLSIGGNQGGFSSICQTFNGSTWASTGSLNTAKYALGGCGLQNAALAFGGSISGGTTAVTEKFNGTTWSTTGSLIFARSNTAGAGTQDNAVAFGGTGATTTATTERFNSSTWSSSTSMPTATYDLGGAGTQNSALAMGGTSTTQTTVKYNATITAGLYFTNTLARTAAVVNSTAGSETDQAASVSAMKSYISSLGLTSPSVSGFTDYSFESTSLSGKVTFSNPEDLFSFNIWMTGDPKNTQVIYSGGAGVQNGAICFGGNLSNAAQNITEFFNGNNWSTGGNLPAVKIAMASFGISNSAISATGGDPNNASNLPVSGSERYNGTAWITGANVNTASFYPSGTGVLNNGMCITGRTSSGGGGIVLTTRTERYNGSTWSTLAALTTARYQAVAIGNSNAAVINGGWDSSGLAVNSSEIYNGSTWSAATRFLGGAARNASGIRNAALFCNGVSNTTFSSFKYNGSVYMNVGVAPGDGTYNASCGTQNAAITFGRITQKFTGDINQSFNLNYRTSNDFIAVSSKDSPLTINLGGGTLQIEMSLEKNNGVSILDKNEIADDGKESYPIGIWSASAHLTGARYRHGVIGTQKSSVAIGGIGSSAPLITCEVFDGYSWALTGPITSAKYYFGSAGIRNSGLIFGGTLNTSDIQTTTLSFNGSTWSAASSLNIGRYDNRGTGVQNAAITFRGTVSTGNADVEKYNGSIWSISCSALSASGGTACIGTQNSALTQNGSSTEKYNGLFIHTVSTSANALGQSNSYAGMAGVPNAALVFGGQSSTYGNITSKFDGYIYSSDSDMLSGGDAVGGCGLQNSAMACGGGISFAPQTITQFFNYDFDFIPKTTGFASWSTSGSLTTARYALGGSGDSQTSLAFGGTSNGTTGLNNSEKFNGSIWSSTGSLATARFGIAGCGTVNASLAFGGTTGTVSAVTERYNGSTWSSTGALSVARSYIVGVGNQYSALAIAGSPASGNAPVETFNGSTWSTDSASYVNGSTWAGAGRKNFCVIFSASNVYSYYGKGLGQQYSYSGTQLPSSQTNATGIGTANACIAAGGSPTSAPSTVTQLLTKFGTNPYQGYWTVGRSLSTARVSSAGSGTQASAIIFGGQTTGNAATNTTEKYTQTFAGGLQYG